jgi:4'-phosphopantetheinyl transferase
VSAVSALAERVSPFPAGAARDRVDVWQASLDLSPADAAASLLRLDPGERERAARLRLGRWRWVAARATLRSVLGHYLGVEPLRVRLEEGPGGKPGLAPRGGPDVRFSLSHTGAIALVAVRLGHDVGVDAEEVRDGVDAESIAHEQFSRHERAVLAALATEGRRVAFFHAWVRREALAKASGHGLAAPARADDLARFAVRGLAGVPGCAAAVASEGTGWRVLRVSAGQPAPA